MDNEFDKRVEEFRFHYFNMYGAKLDDEILYVFVRMNEMHVDLKKQIKNIPKVSFNSRWDYFMYGLGRFTMAATISSLVLIVSYLLYKNNMDTSATDKTVESPLKIRVQVGDTTYTLPLRKKT